MVGDSDLQVWLDRQPNAAQTVLIPYVKSVKEMKLDFRLNVVQVSKAGASRISQGGTITLDASKPAALSKVSLRLHDTDACDIHLTLSEGGQEVGRYDFACPR